MESSQSNNLSRDLNNSNGRRKRSAVKRSYECHYCQIIFTTKYALFRHLFITRCKKSPDYTPKASAASTKSYECTYCQKEFKTKFSVRRHMNGVRCEKSFHSDTTTREITFFECDDCKTRYTRKGSLEYHLSTGTCKRSKERQYGCLQCGDRLPTKTVLMEHYSKNHGIPLKWTIKTFQSLEEFQSWMRDIERENIIRFCLMDTTQSRLYINKRYACHRSDKYVDVNNCSKRRLQRFLKNYESEKLQGWCPAELRLKVRHSDGACVVEYQETHVGHIIGDEKELSHVYLKKEEKLELAARLAEGVAIPHSKKDINSSDAITQDRSRISLVNLTDLQNIASYFEVERDRPLPLNDAEIDINEFIEEHKESILYYKEQGEEDTKYNALGNDDLAIVFMNKDQEVALKSFAGHLVCFDGIHGTNPYEFTIHTMLIVDVDSREGNPVAFLISNKNNRSVIDVMLWNIREKIGTIETKFFMTDMHALYFNSWVAVMGNEPEYHFYCTWHVREAWRKNIFKIKNKETRLYVSRGLSALGIEKCSNIFEEKLKEFLQGLENDPHAESYLRYFTENYLPDTRHWAWCYQREFGIDTTNMHLDLFRRRSLTFICGKKKIKTLSDCLSYILVYSLSVQKIDNRVKRIPMKSSKLDKLHTRHRKTVDYMERNGSVTIYPVDEETFIVQSLGESEEDMSKMYTISKNESKECAEAGMECLLFCNSCGICFHEYHCSCLDSSEENNMCEHIHALGIASKSQGNQSINDYLVCEETDIKFENDIDMNTFDVNDDDADQIPSHCENIEVEAKKRIIGEMKEMLDNFLSIATSKEQLYEIKEKYLLPIKPALFNLVKKRSS